MHYPITVFGVKDTTRLFVQYLNENVCHVDLVVTISNKLTEGATISSYGSMVDLKAFNTEIYETTAYTLDDETTKTFFSNNTFGIGISMGWSRLIPEYVLECFNPGVFGLHGSCGYLPYGQGRATLNWSLIRGDWRYVMHLFKLDKYADSPNIYAKEMFEVNEFDDIRTMQFKDLIVSKRLVSRLLRDYTEGRPITTTYADKDIQEWYKGRKPEDGRISFLMKTREIYNLVRAVTRPFPGAFAFTGDKLKVMIWAAQPFDRIIDFSDSRPGEVLDVLDKSLLLRTIDGSLLVTEHECDRLIVKGDILC